MNYTEEYVEQLEKIMASLREELRNRKDEIASLHEKLAAAEKQIEALKAENERLSERGTETVCVVRSDSLLSFFELTEVELRVLAPKAEPMSEPEPKPSPIKDFEIKNGVLKKYVGKGGDVVIPGDVKCIDKNAFWNCKTLTRITIPNGVTSIGDGAFFGCSLKSITVPDSVTSIGADVFFGCDNPTIKCKTGSYAEKYCKTNNLSYSTSVKVPVSATVKPATDLKIKPSPREDFEIWNGVLIKYIGQGGDVFIPGGVTRINDGAFAEFKSLKSVTIPDGVKSIGYGAFFNCESLSSITIPDSITNIGDDVFLGCPSLKLQCTAGSYAAKYVKDKKINNSQRMTEVPNRSEDFEIENGVLKKYRGKGGDVAVPYGIRSIGEEAFAYCSSLTNVTIIKGVTCIGNQAFNGCEKLTSVTIPDGVTSIGNYAFNKCKSLTNVTIPESVSSIGNNSFSHCESLASVTIPSIVRKIDDWMFCGCYSLTSVTIPNFLTSIGMGAFMGCFSLTELIIPDSVTNIGSQAFDICRKLTIKCRSGSYAAEYCWKNNIIYTTTL